MPFYPGRGVLELTEMALHIKVRRTRPRVYLSEYNLADIRRRVETTHIEEWSQLVVWSRGIARTPPEYRLRDERLGERARRLAFMHAVRPEERLVEMALEMVPALVKLTGRLPASPTGIEALSLLYDSFHAKLPDALAVEGAEALARGAEDIFRERIKGRPVLDETRSQAVAPLLTAGLSLYVEHPAASLEVSRRIIGQAVHASRDLVGTLQYFLEKDGGFPLGWAEGLTHLGQVPKLAMLAESGLDQAWPRDVPWLARYAERLAPRPEALSGLDRAPEARKLWEHVLYFEQHAETMNYPEYRARGWPVGSGTVESACGRFGLRVKRTCMRWTRRVADSVHTIMAAIFSEDDRWAKRWPGGIPVLKAAA